MAKIGYVSMIVLFFTAVFFGCQEPREDFPTNEPSAQPSESPMPVSEEWNNSAMKLPYRIQVGDVISVRFFNEARLDDTVTVRPDGRISLTPVDDVPAAGLTPEELDAELSKKFSEVLNKPDLSVIVREFAAQRIFVGGEVQKPGIQELDSNASVLSAIIQAGGPMTSAAMDCVLLIRRGEANQCAVMKMNIHQTLRYGTGDILLHPYDVIYVPKTLITHVGDFVEQYVNRIVPRSLGFQFLYNLNPQVAIESDQTDLLFSRTRLRQ